MQKDRKIKEPSSKNPNEKPGKVQEPPIHDEDGKSIEDGPMPGEESAP
jgi:hypothetical protein